MYLEFVLGVSVIRYLRNTLKKQGVLSGWSQLLTGGVIVLIALVIIEITLPDKGIAALLIDGVVLYLVYIMLNRKELVAAKFLGYAVLPYIIVSLISNLAEIIDTRFFDKWDDYFNTAEVFAVLWLVAMWIISKKQRKAQEAERLKAIEKEKEYAITASLKAELEVQVEERTAALTLQKEQLQETVNELKTTQAQLVQSEKMASLGELTAGIAHEIQNPLNFVNNFSEVNTELIAELREAIDNGRLDEAKSIADDITANEAKINHHGKRADAIVKGMLQHSRSSGGHKEAADINALADEYLRLAYHGLRAKDKSFNASMKTDFDPSLSAGGAAAGTVQIIPQDIGRVILNLITNAFYAVTEKKKASALAAASSNETVKYEPTVTVSTKKRGNRVEVQVKDNGNGIPLHVLDKIFQPFFTTKPTGEGTGLGLSMSYDIVTKGHGGELKVETKEKEGSTFTINLPVTAQTPVK